MKAIETQYQGCRFRSRLEARWAVFFDAMRLAWTYEPEGVVTPAGGYLPDFWLPGLELWVEVKPGAPTEQERQKASELLLGTRRPVFITAGLPDVAGEVHWSYTAQGGEWNWHHAPGWVDWNSSRALGRCCMEVLGTDVAGDDSDHDHRPAQLRRGVGLELSGPALDALYEAKGARFEFGESGGPGG